MASSDVDLLAKSICGSDIRKFEERYNAWKKDSSKEPAEFVNIAPWFLMDGDFDRVRARNLVSGPNCRKRITLFGNMGQTFDEKEIERMIRGAEKGDIDTSIIAAKATMERPNGIIKKGLEKLFEKYGSKSGEVVVRITLDSDGKLKNIESTTATFNMRGALAEELVANLLRHKGEMLGLVAPGEVTFPYTIFVR